MNIPDPMIKIRQISSSLVCIYCIASVSIYCFLNMGKWRQSSIIAVDAVSYYAYLPAVFIYHDLSLSFLDKPDCPKDVVMWPEKAPNANKVIKTSMGMSVFYAPFFFAAHICAPLFHFPATGYSPIYHLFIGFTGAFYLFLGLFFLRKILLRYFSERITSLTLILISISTNMLFFFTVDTLNAHIVCFFLINCFLFFTLKWHEEQKKRYLLVLGICLGLLTLTRPSNILVAFLFVLYSVYDIPSLKAKTTLLKKHFFSLILIPLLTVLAFVPQLLYWRRMTGHFFFNSYVGENFFFSHPHIIDGLFSYRKGWLVYSPVFILFFAGLFLMRGALKNWKMAILLFYVPMTYIVFSWWCWWYGGGYGMRAYIDFYGLFALPIAAVLLAAKSSGKQLHVYTLGVVCSLFLLLNIFQTYQCKRNIIHYDSMTREKYWSVFLRLGPETSLSDHFLKAPDYKKAKLGQKED
jgi:hypothetical protein